MSNDKLAEALRDAEATVLAFLGDVAFDGSVCGIKQAIVKGMFARLQAHAAEAAQAQAQSVVWNIPEARPKVTVDHDSVECGDLYTLEDACWNDGWNACREAMLNTAPQQAAEPVGEVVGVTGSVGEMRVIRWRGTYSPEVGTKLYTHPQPAQSALSRRLAASGRRGENCATSWMKSTWRRRAPERTSS